jgi:hypothetical protein
MGRERSQDKGDVSPATVGMEWLDPFEAAGVGIRLVAQATEPLIA